MFLSKKILRNKGGEMTHMTIDEIKKLIQVGEKIDVEFKESKNALTKDVFDTVCSFNNRNGGHILLGVNDKREIVGVSEDKVVKVIKEFTTAINNPQKMYPPLYLIPEVFDIDEKKIIYIRVPEGYQVCRHNGRIWDRSYEGDLNITNHSELVYKLYACGDNSVDTKDINLEILHFKQFYKHFVFEKDEEGYVKKTQKNYMDVRVVLQLV